MGLQGPGALRMTAPLLLVVVGWWGGMCACPTACQCTEQGGLVVQCMARGLEAVPTELPVDAAALQLAHNRIHRVPGVDFCAAPRHTADVAALVAMFCWVVMVTAYVVYYVHHNREDARQRVGYRKSLPRECDVASSVL